MAILMGKGGKSWKLKGVPSILLEQQGRRLRNVKKGDIINEVREYILPYRFDANGKVEYTQSTETAPESWGDSQFGAESKLPCGYYDNKYYDYMYERIDAPNTNDYYVPYNQGGFNYTDGVADNGTGKTTVFVKLADGYALQATYPSPSSMWITKTQLSNYTKTLLSIYGTGTNVIMDGGVIKRSKGATGTDTDIARPLSDELKNGTIEIKLYSYKNKDAFAQKTYHLNHKLLSYDLPSNEEDLVVKNDDNEYILLVRNSRFLSGVKILKIDDYNLIFFYQQVVDNGISICLNARLLHFSHDYKSISTKFLRIDSQTASIPMPASVHSLVYKNSVGYYPLWFNSWHPEEFFMPSIYRVSQKYTGESYSNGISYRHYKISLDFGCRSLKLYPENFACKLEDIEGTFSSKYVSYFEYMLAESVVSQSALCVSSIGKDGNLTNYTSSLKQMLPIMRGSHLFNQHMKSYVMEYELKVPVNDVDFESTSWKSEMWSATDGQGCPYLIDRTSNICGDISVKIPDNKEKEAVNTREGGWYSHTEGTGQQISIAGPIYPPKPFFKPNEIEFKLSKDAFVYMRLFDKEYIGDDDELNCDTYVLENIGVRMATASFELNKSNNSYERLVIVYGNFQFIKNGDLTGTNWSKIGNWYPKPKVYSYIVNIKDNSVISAKSLVDFFGYNMGLQSIYKNQPFVIKDDHVVGENLLWNSDDNIRRPSNYPDIRRTEKIIYTDYDGFSYNGKYRTNSFVTDTGELRTFFKDINKNMALLVVNGYKNNHRDFKNDQLSDQYRWTMPTKIYVLNKGNIYRLLSGETNIEPFMEIKMGENAIRYGYAKDGVENTTFIEDDNFIVDESQIKITPIVTQSATFDSGSAEIAVDYSYSYKIELFDCNTGREISFVINSNAFDRSYYSNSEEMFVENIIQEEITNNRISDEIIAFEKSRFYTDHPSNGVEIASFIAIATEDYNPTNGEVKANFIDYANRPLSITYKKYEDGVHSAATVTKTFLGTEYKPIK